MSAAEPAPNTRTVVFVGRERELATLGTRLNAAFGGQGSVAMLAGEAGVGKTRLALEFAQRARARGAAVLSGACHEGEWSPPYGPWVDALGEHARGLGPDRLRGHLTTGAAALAQLLPEVRTVAPQELAAPLAPDEERYRLFEAVTRFLLAAAREQPTVVLLDDLHWADRETLGTLRHLARYLGRARLLVVGAYRDPDLGFDRHHPLADALAVLRREADHERIHLRGLSDAEVAAYLAAAAHRELPPALVQAIQLETNGNPFYAGELLLHLVEEGTLQHEVSQQPASEDGATDARERWEALGVPEGIRRVLGRRLARLSATTNTVLRSAAAMTGGFRFPVMQALTGLPDDALLDCIDEAMAAGLLRTVSTGATDASAGTVPPAYDFTHAIVRHTLYAELNPDRRVRLHRRVAEVLESVYAERLPDIAAELAAQYHASAALPGAERGVAAAVAAAEQARRGAAPDRVVSFLRMARDMAAPQVPAARADVLTRLALAEAEALQLVEAPRTAAAAVAALDEVRAPSHAVAEFLARVARALKDGGAAAAVWDPLVGRGLSLIGDRQDRPPLLEAAGPTYEAAAPRPAGRRALTWARLTLLRDRLEPLAMGMVTISRWLGHDPEATAIARAEGDEDDYAQTLEPFDWRTREQSEAVLALARSWQRPTAVYRALNAAARDMLFYHGAFREAEALGRELLETATRFGSISGQVEALAQLATVRLTLGELLLARQSLQRAQELAARLGSVHRLHVILEAAIPICVAYYLEGDWTGLAAVAARLTAGPAAGRRGLHGLILGPLAALCYARAGDAAAARRMLEAITSVLTKLDPQTHQFNVAVHAAASAIWELDVRELAPSYRRMAIDLLAAGIGDSVLGSSALVAARMAVLLGEAATADASFARARALLDASGQRPLRAIADYDAALALVRAGSTGTATDSDQLVTLLDAALVGFRALGMEGWIARADRLKEMHLRQAARTEHTQPAGLTTREAEVLRLVAGGKSNREIAETLVISVATAERHVANVYAKIGARGRVEATTFALRHGLAVEAP